MKEIKTINQRIKIVMNSFGYDDPHFARKIGVSIGAIHNVVDNNDDPSYAMLRNICTVLPVSQRWLMIGEGNPWTVDSINKWISESKDSHQDIDKEINDRFREFRIKSGLSQTVMASEVGVTRDIVSNIENYRGSPSIHVLISLHKRFGVNPMWLLYGDPPMIVSNKGRS